MKILQSKLISLVMFFLLIFLHSCNSGNMNGTYIGTSERGIAGTITVELLSKNNFVWTERKGSFNGIYQISNNNVIYLNFQIGNTVKATLSGDTLVVQLDTGKVPLIKTKTE